MGEIGEGIGESGEKARRPASRERAAEKRVLTQPPATTPANSREGAFEALMESYRDSKPDAICMFLQLIGAIAITETDMTKQRRNLL